VEWFLKKVGPTSAEVNCDDVKGMVNGDQLAAVYIGDTNSAEFKTY
jgi:hypothetical protein